MQIFNFHEKYIKIDWLDIRFVFGIEFAPILSRFQKFDCR
jgi:hypothetical protein